MFHSVSEVAFNRVLSGRTPLLEVEWIRNGIARTRYHVRVYYLAGQYTTVVKRNNLNFIVKNTIVRELEVEYWKSHGETEEMRSWLLWKRK